MVMLKKVFSFITNIFILIEVILITIFTLPNLFSIKPYVVTSGSMEPKYPVGSLIYVKDIKIEELKKGDVITFYLTNSKIVATHKIYEINSSEKSFITYGINNKDEEGNIIKDVNPVRYDDVIGKPILCIPYLGYINKYITSTPGIYIVIGITMLLVGTSFLIDNIKKEEVGKNE